jgi:hypothetical protein
VERSSPGRISCGYDGTGVEDMSGMGLSVVMIDRKVQSKRNLYFRGILLLGNYDGTWMYKDVDG